MSPMLAINMFKIVVKLLVIIFFFDPISPLYPFPPQEDLIFNEDKCRLNIRQT